MNFDSLIYKESVEKGEEISRKKKRTKKEKREENKKNGEKWLKN